MATKGPQQLKQEERRAQKLAEIRAQVAEGRLTIRQMTAAERKQHPKPAQKPASKRGGGTARQRGRG